MQSRAKRDLPLCLYMRLLPSLKRLRPNRTYADLSPSFVAGWHKEIRASDSRGTHGGTPRAFGTLRTIVTLGTKRIPLNGSDVHGRAWDRTRDLSRVKRALSR